MKLLFCSSGCRQCHNSNTFDFDDCCSSDDDDCDNSCDEKKENCKECHSECEKKKEFRPGTCRHCGGKDDYAYVSGGDGMICCWLCKLDGKC